MSTENNFEGGKAGVTVLPEDTPTGIDCQLGTKKTKHEAETEQSSSFEMVTFLFC